MTRIPMSSAASALLRALLTRAGASQNRILLSEIHSVDWQSLTLTGERHTIILRVQGDEADTIALSLLSGIEEAEFAINGQIVADIAVTGDPVREADGSITLSIEALTVTE